MALLTMTQAETLTVKQLRDYARNNNSHSMTGKEIVMASKAALVSALSWDAPKSDNLFKEPPQPTNQSHEIAPGSTDNLADILATALQGKIQGSIDETAVRDIATAIIDKRFEDFKPAIKKIVIKNVEAGTEKDLGMQHKTFETILGLASRRKNIMLVGPAGSGKTTCCKNVAKALDLSFNYQAVCMQSTISQVFGYMDANGDYVKTPFWDSYKNGGVFLLDEIDAGNPNVLTSYNAAIDNGIASFPTGMIERHPNFICIAAANTFGFGGNIEYVGRNAMDAATRDRFRMLPFEYDETLERALAGDDSWVDRVQAIRAAIIELREKNVLASPRASIEGADDLANGFTQEQVEDMLIFKGINPEVKNRILGRL